MKYTQYDEAVNRNAFVPIDLSYLLAQDLEGNETAKEETIRRNNPQQVRSAQLPQRSYLERRTFGR